MPRPARTRRLWLRWVLLGILAMLVLREMTFDINRVPSASMLPTLQIGDRVVVNRLAYGLRVPFSTSFCINWSRPRRFDVVVFYPPGYNRLFVKRIVGLPGETVEVQGGEVSVPQGCYFVLGDFHEGSKDSRDFGCVPVSRIVGRVEGVAFSLDPMSSYLPRADRWCCAVR